jgi:PAS domain S-box-containing protein
MNLKFPFGADFQAILSLIGDAVVSTDHEGQIIFLNPAAETMFGYPYDELIGNPISVLIPLRFHGRHQVDHGVFCAADIATHRAMGAGREVQGRRKDGTEFAVEISLSHQLLDGHHIGTAVVRDVSVRIAAEKQRQLVADEVAHRLRNLMAVINSIVSLSAKLSSSAENLKDALLGRFAAISRTNESLIHRSWIEVGLRELFESELAPYRNDVRSITLQGPEIAIKQKIAVALALVIHELATNASKYGAFSTQTGGLEVRWRITAAGKKSVLEVTWQESGGPEVVAPAKRGFGSVLISGSLRGHGGRAELTYPAAGVQCDLSLPLG